MAADAIVHFSVLAKDDDIIIITRNMMNYILMAIPVFFVLILLELAWAYYKKKEVLVTNKQSRSNKLSRMGSPRPTGTYQIQPICFSLIKTIKTRTP